MQYISTRDARRPPERLAFEAVLLAGLARDGGLYVPESFPKLDAAELRALRGRSYAEIAAAVMAPFLGPAVDAAQFRRLVDRHDQAARGCQVQRWHAHERGVGPLLARSPPEHERLDPAE